MSGAAFTSGSGGDLSITVGTQSIAGWESVQVTRSCELIPNHFVLTMAEPLPDDPARILAQPGAPCTVRIGADTVLTGYVDRIDMRYGGGRHEVTVTGRGKTEDLVDCSADLLADTSTFPNGAVVVQNALELAAKLAKPFGIEARSVVADLGLPIAPFQIALGDKPYEIIEQVARYAGYLVYEDEAGALVLDRIGTAAAASGFAEGVNVEAADVSLSVDGRFTDITTVWTTYDTLSEGAGVNQANRTGQSLDPAFAALGRHRPRIVQTQQTDNTPTFGQRCADWEMARRRGRSQQVQLTCDSWRDKDGKLWEPNTLVALDLPRLKVSGRQWVIGTVTFRKDAEGTHADLVLMPPEAFSLQPSTLYLFDREIGAGVPTTQDPAPPSTGTAGLLGRP